MDLTTRISRYINDDSTLLIVFAMLACVIHGAMRIYDLDRASLWCDESLTWWMSNWSLNTLVSAMLDVHPPLYFGLMGLWKHLFGSSEFSLRLVSVIFSISTLLMLFLHAEALNQDRKLWIFPVTALLFCFSPYEIHLSRFARSFTMLMFICTAFSYSYFKFIISGDKRYWALSLPVGIAAVYTHHLALLYVPCAIFAGFLLKRRLKTGLYALSLGAIIAFSYLPWSIMLPLQMVIKQFQYHYHSLADVSAAALLSLINPYPVGVIYSGLDNSLLKISGLALSLAAIAIVIVQAKECWRNLWTRGLLIQSGLIALFISVSPTPLLNERNLCIIFPSAVLLISYAIVTLPRPGLIYVGTAFLTAFVAVSLAGFPHSNRAPDWRAALKHVAEMNLVPESTVLIIRPVYEGPTLDYYCLQGLVSDELFRMERVGYGHSDVSSVVRQIFSSEKEVTDVIVLSSKWADGRPDDLTHQADFVVSETKEFMALDFYRLRRNNVGASK